MLKGHFVIKYDLKSDITFIRNMQKLLGIIFIAVGLFGAVYASKNIGSQSTFRSKKREGKNNK
jgi:hypothetical protein